MAAKKRILIVDDDACHSQLCKLVLEKRGYEVMELSNSIYALPIAILSKPDFIFTDNNMRQFTGIEVTKMLKQHKSTKHIPVIHFSSCDDIVKEVEKAGADYYLQKPFKFDSLFEAINNIERKLEVE